MGKPEAINESLPSAKSYRPTVRDARNAYRRAEEAHLDREQTSEFMEMLFDRRLDELAGILGL